MSLTGRVALITGGGSGIGRASALVLARGGSTVVVTDLVESRAQEVAAEIVAEGGTALPLHLDVADEDMIATAIAEAVRRLDRLDILHNNAASVGSDGLTRKDLDLTLMDPMVWDGTMTVNLRGAMLACKHAIPVMLKQGSGAIVNTSSISALTGELDRFAYAASKAGLIALTQHVATRYGKNGIRCNAVAPGLIVTKATMAALTPEMFAIYQRHHLTPYLGEPEDVANLVAFLVSDRARFITGQVIRVDGGLLSHAPMFADMFEALET